MAKLLTAYMTDGTPNTETIPDATDFMYVYFPTQLPSPVPEYDELRAKFLAMPATISLEKVVEWLNGEVDNFFPLYFGGLDYWLTERAEWWRKAPLGLRKAFVSTWLPFIKVIPPPDMVKDIYAFPISDILDVLAEVGAVHLLSVPVDNIIAPDEERTLQYVEEILSGSAPAGAEGDGTAPTTVSEAAPNSPDRDGGEHTHQDPHPGEVCCTHGKEPDGAPLSGGESSCCGSGCCGD